MLKILKVENNGRKYLESFIFIHDYLGETR